MRFVFNPTTGNLDLVNSSTSGSTFGKVKTLVDGGFLITPDINLGATPVINSEVVSLNGLEIDDSNYSIVGTVLTMVTTQLKIGDNIYVNFAS